MANIPELQEAILKALDAVVTQRNNDLKLDKTITAIVKKNVGVRHGKPVYQVEYTGGILEAVCQSSEDIYIPQTSVYVLVPEGNFSKEKIIIGRASSIVTDRTASIVAAAVNQFSIIGTNLLLGKSDDIKNIQFGLRSFHPRSADEKRFHNKSHRYQVLYDASDSSNNSIIFDSERLNIYKEDSTALMIKADFLTNLDLAQRQKVGAKYGLIFNFVFENLNKGYGETNGEILENITKDIVLTEDEKTKSVFKLGEEFINNSESNLDLWKIENTGFIDQFLEKINAAYLNFQNKYPEKNTDLVTATLLAYQVAVSELKNCNSVEDIKAKYQEWKKTSVGDLEDKTISYAWTSDDMIGNPMSFNTWNTQYQVFNMDFKTLSHLESIVFFKEGFIEDEKFEQQWPISEISNGGGPDIFVKNLQIYAMNPLEIQSGDYTLKVESSTNSDMIFKGVSNKEEITLKAFLTRKMYEDLSNNTNTSYIWFKEDSSVIGTQSDNYHALGGIGWRKISEGTSSSRYITLKSEDNQAYKNNYKCIAIYEPSSDDKAILSYPFIVYNTAAQIDIMLESDLGTHFSYDAGTPTIRVLIKDTTTKENFYELGYSPQEQNPKYKYKWAIADSANNYILFLDEVFNDEGISESGMINSIKQSQLDKIEKIIQYEGNSLKTEIPWRATRIKYPVSISSSGFTVTCYVQKLKDEHASEIEYVDVGSASLEFLNQEDSITSDYRIQIVNGDQVFQYDEYGDSPCSTKKKNPLEILPLQVKLYTPSGIEVSGSNYQVEWIFPIENTLISLKENEDGESPQFIINPATNLLQLIKGHEVNFDIAKIYDPNAFANQITCHVSFGGKDYYKDTNFYFGKQGSNGTNGTDFVAKIGYIGNSANDDLSLLIREPLTLYLQKTENNSNNKMFNVDKKWWEGDISSDKFGITSKDNESKGLSLSLYQKNTEIKPTIYQWSLAGNPLQDEKTLNTFNRYFQIETNNDTILTKIVFNDELNDDKLKKNLLLVQNIRAEAKVIIKDENNKEITQSYYAFYSLPIIWYEKIDEEKNIPDVTKLLSINKIAIDKHSYLNEIIYNADGRNPIYNHNQGLKLINIPSSIKKIIFNVKGGKNIEEDEPCIKLLKNKDDQEGLEEITLERNSEDSTIWNYIDGENINGNINEPIVYILPDDIYDGSATNNRIEAKLYNHINEKENLVATVYAPINMTLNTFGLASLNAWDGNTVTIDKEGGYVMAPQIGAGEKDDNNRFTGILMGKTETYTGGGDNEEEVGLFGYAHGLQSIFLDAKTGNATFGLPDVDTALDENDKVIYTNYHNTNISGSDDYNEGRIELRPGDVSKIGGWRLGRSSLYYITKYEKNERKEDTWDSVGLTEIGDPYRGDYVPNLKTREITWNGEGKPGLYNKYHDKDIPHDSAGILLQAGGHPYISIKGKPLDASEVRDLSGIENEYKTNRDFNDDKKGSDSYLKAGDSLEIQLDPSAPSLFSIFRHNGSDRFEQKIDDENINNEPKYKKNTRTFLAGINGKGEFVANTIRNVTTTLPAFIGNDNYPETSYVTNFAVNTIPAFGDFKPFPTHIGFKMDVGEYTLGQLFISAIGNPTLEDESWKINNYNEKGHSIDTNEKTFTDSETETEKTMIINDPTLRISGGKVNDDNEKIYNYDYGEYARPIALHGKSISLFSYPTDLTTAELCSKVLFSNNHLILETDNNTSKFQLSLGDNTGSSNTLIHLKGYDDNSNNNDDININSEKIKGSKINIATDLETNIGVFQDMGKIDFIKEEGDKEVELWRYGSDRYIKVGYPEGAQSSDDAKYVNKNLVYPDFYIRQEKNGVVSYRPIKELNIYYKGNNKYYFLKSAIDDIYNNIDDTLREKYFYYYKINDEYILWIDIKNRIYKKDENGNFKELTDSDELDIDKLNEYKNYYWQFFDDKYLYITKTSYEKRAERGKYYYGIKISGNDNDKNNNYYEIDGSLTNCYKIIFDDQESFISKEDYDEQLYWKFEKVNNNNESNNNNIQYGYRNAEIVAYKVENDNRYPFIWSQYLNPNSKLYKKVITKNEDDNNTESVSYSQIWGEGTSEIWEKWSTDNNSLDDDIYIKIDEDYILLKNIIHTIPYYTIDNTDTLYKRLEKNIEYIRIEQQYYNSAKIKSKEDNNYYKDNSNNIYQISNINNIYYQYKVDSSSYYLTDQDVFDITEYKKDNDKYKIIGENESIDDKYIYYLTSKFLGNYKELIKVWTDQKKYMLASKKSGNNVVDEYIFIENFSLGQINRETEYYFINSEFQTSISGRYKKIYNIVTEKEEYLLALDDNELKKQYVKSLSDSNKYYDVSSKYSREVEKTIPQKTYFFNSGSLEANIGLSEDLYSSLKIDNKNISLINKNPNQIINIEASSPHFLFKNYVGEIRLQQDGFKYDEDLFHGEYKPTIKADFSIFTSENGIEGYKNYGLFLMHDAFTLNGLNYGEISTNDRLWIIANNTGNDKAYHVGDPQIAIRAGSRKMIVPGGTESAVELILNSSTTGWNKSWTSRTMSQFPVFAVRSRGGNIGIYPEYFSQYHSYRENFLVNMNEAISEGLHVQGIFQGGKYVISAPKPDDIFWNSKKNVDNFIGIKSDYSIFTDNYVIAGGFKGNGIRIAHTTDLDDVTNKGGGNISIDGNSSRSGWGPGETISLGVSAPTFTISQGRLHSIDSAGNTISITLSRDIVTTQVLENRLKALNGIDTKLREIEGHLNDLRTKYNNHVHKVENNKYTEGTNAKVLGW